MVVEFRESFVYVLKLLVLGVVPERAVEVARSGEPRFEPTATANTAALPGALDLLVPRSPSPPERVIFIKGPPRVKYDSVAAR